MTPQPARDKPVGKGKHKPNLRIEDPSTVELRYMEDTGMRYHGPQGRPTQMKKPKRVRRARFYKGQVVRNLISDTFEKIVSEPWLTDLDGHTPDSYCYDMDSRAQLIECEMRPLTAKEIGPRRKQGR